MFSLSGRMLSEALQTLHKWLSLDRFRRPPVHRESTQTSLLIMLTREWWYGWHLLHSFRGVRTLFLIKGGVYVTAELLPTQTTPRKSDDGDDGGSWSKVATIPDTKYSGRRSGKLIMLLRTILQKWTINTKYFQHLGPFN